jgi:eukaryotic-like serine/threonine-protein kinase
MAVTLQDLPALYRLIDEGWDLDAAARERWLATLPSEHERLKQTLDDMLSRRSGVETDLFAKPLGQATAAWVEGSDVGGYRLIREIGLGGMGAVWLAEPSDGVLKRRVALKLPLFAIHNKSLAERFDRERDILASLTHPNIARLYDAGTTPSGQPYMALEYVEGLAITQHCDAQKLSIRDRIALFLQVLGAVQHAHSNLVLHRDLKPSNVLVTPDGQVKLLDFGIAKLISSTDAAAEESALTQVGGQALTPDYASPEQIGGAALTTASDVYSLSVLLYEMLTGERPYKLKVRGRAALEEAIAHIEPVKASQMIRTASDLAARADARRTTAKKFAQLLAGDLDTILAKALKKLPAARYATASAFAADLQHYLTGDAVAAQPDSRWYQLRKMVGRNKVAVGSMATVMMALASGVGIASWQAMEARSERARAERVKDLISAIFASASPATSGKLELTVRDLLRAGVDRVEGELQNEPAVAAELMLVLGKSYYDLGDIDLAYKTVLAANERAKSAVPMHHPMRALILSTLGQLTKEKGNAAEAQKLSEQAIQMQRKLGADGELDLAQSLISLGGILISQAHMEEAIAVKREAVEILTRARGANDTKTIAAIGSLSNSLMIGNRAKESLVEAKRAHELALAVFPDRKHPVLFDQMAHLAYALQANGQYQAAKDQWQAVIDAERKAFNPRGTQVTGRLMGLALIQELLGELKPAMQTYEESLSILQEYTTAVNGELTIRHYSIGRVALKSRQAEKATRFLTTAIEYGNAVYGARGGRVRDGQNLQVAALIHAGRFAEAQTILDTQIADDRQSNSPALRSALRNSALLDIARGTVSAPLPKMTEVKDIESKLKNIPRVAAALTLGEMGRAQLVSKRKDATQLNEAAESLEKAMVIFSEEVATPMPEHIDVWVALGRARLEQGRLEEALVLFEKANQFWTQFDSANAFAGEAAFWHGTALGEKRESRRAHEEWSRAAKLLKVSAWPSHQQLAMRAQRNLEQ